MRDQDRKDRFIELRRQAQALLKSLPEKDAAFRHFLDLIHEIESSQKELESKIQELSSRDQEYTDLYELAPCGYLTLDSKDLITRINSFGEHLLQADRKQLKHMAFRHFVAPEDQEAYDQALKLAANVKTGLSRDLKLFRNNGSPLWVEADIRADRDRSENVTQFRLVLLDRSEKLKAEEKTRALQSRLQQAGKAESLSRMAGAIAHHFNNQLSTVLGNLELAVCSLPEGTLVLENLVQAMRAALRASEMSTMMQTYLGQTKLEPKALDLSETCRRELPGLKDSLPREISLETELSFPGPVVQANWGQLQQVLTYLLNNAREAIDGPGTIFLSTRTISAAKIPASHLAPLDWKPDSDYYAYLEVRDTGRGMTREVIDKCFDPFFSTKRNGRGLGLAVVLGIIKASNGAISLESDPEQGSSLQVFLPIVPDETPGQRETAEESKEFPGQGAVLLVEDQDSVRKIVKNMLEHLGFEVLAAREGSEAIEIFRNNTEAVACVLTDLSMPGMDGWETLEALRKIDPGIPAILASGYDQTRVMAGNHEELPQGFLAKPYQLSELKSTLARILQEKTS